MKFLVFMTTWIGFASIVDFFAIPNVWAMLFGVISLLTSDFINYALWSKHERA